MFDSEEQWPAMRTPSSGLAPEGQACASSSGLARSFRRQAETRKALMLLAETFWQVIWTIFVVFAWVIWIWLLIVVFSDLFRRHDTSGWAKAAWVLFVFLLPYLGVLVYLIAEGKGMAERKQRDAQAAQSSFDDYVRTAAGRNDPSAQIAQAKQLLDTGAINQAEFEQLKAKALAS
jgi:hypothetical protein